MKAICEGRKNRREVVEESLNQYRDVYLRVQQQLPKLHDVSLSSRSETSQTDISRLFESMCSKKVKVWGGRIHTGCYWDMTIWWISKYIVFQSTLVASKRDGIQYCIENIMSTKIE